MEQKIVKIQLNPKLVLPKRSIKFIKLYSQRKKEKRHKLLLSTEKKKTSLLILKKDIQRRYYL